MTMEICRDGREIWGAGLGRQGGEGCGQIKYFKPPGETAATQVDDSLIGFPF